MTLTEENALLKEALLGLRGLAVLEATHSGTWQKAIEQIDDALWKVGINVELLDQPADDMPTLREEREARSQRLDDPHRGAVPREWKR